MKLAVLADIHGNLEALTTVLEDAARRGVHRTMCLGDLVGYGASPHECIGRLRELPKTGTVLGNHDAAVFWQSSPYGMNAAARESIMWTMEQLQDDDMDYLRTLKPIRKMGDMLFSHANPYNSRGYRYVNNRKYALRSFAATSEQLLFVGHTHRPLVITRRNLLQLDFRTPEPGEVLPIMADKRQIINGGSVGQPRDGDPRASYCIVNTREKSVGFYRLDYDRQRSAERIREAGLPSFHARRLLEGF